MSTNSFLVLIFFNILDKNERMSLLKSILAPPSSQPCSLELQNDFPRLSTLDRVQLHAQQIQHGGDNYQNKPVLSIVSSLHQNIVEADYDLSAWDRRSPGQEYRPIIELSAIQLHREPIFSILSSFCENDTEPNRMDLFGQAKNQSQLVIHNETLTSTDTARSNLTSTFSKAGTMSADPKSAERTAADLDSVEGITAVLQNMADEDLQGTKF